MRRLSSPLLGGSPRAGRPGRTTALLAAVLTSGGLLVASAPTGAALPHPPGAGAGLAPAPEPPTTTLARIVTAAERGATRTVVHRAEDAARVGVRARAAAGAGTATEHRRSPAHQRSSSRSPADHARPAAAQTPSPAPAPTSTTPPAAPRTTEPEPRRTTTPQPRPSTTTPQPRPSTTTQEPRPTTEPSPTPSTTAASTRDGLIASLARRYGITIHPYDHPRAPGRWGTTDLSSCQVWVGRSTPMNRIADVIKHEYGHVLQCRKHTWEGVSTTELERIADAVALRLGASWVNYTSSPTAAEWAAADRLLS